jgi:hypothetical protein
MKNSEINSLPIVELWRHQWYTAVYGLDNRGFESTQRLGILLFTTASRPALGPNQPPIQWVPGAFSPGVKRPGREADHSPPSTAEVKECVELYLHCPNTPTRRDAQLMHTDNFTFTFIFTVVAESKQRLLTT